MIPRIALALCLILLVAGFCATSAEAQKISQLPKGDFSYDFASEMASFWIMADDWVCLDGTPILSIRWWGSYWDTTAPGAYVPYSDYLNGSLAPIDDDDLQFQIGIFANLPADVNVPFARPDVGTPLAGWSVDKGDANESYAFTVQKSADPLVTEKVYSYEVDLTQALPLMQPGPFQQVQGTKYWLVIVADHQELSTQWGWHEADGHWYSYAVQAIGLAEPAWYIPCGGHDMAFELIPIPEPGSIVAWAVGIIGLAGLASRRRNRAI